jgi:hypothetical protein
MKNGMSWIKGSKLTNSTGMGIIIIFYLACIYAVAVPVVGILTAYNIKMPAIYPLQEIQHKFYFAGTRNIWQYDPDCATSDSLSIYSPSIGKCNFENPEFDTTLTFDADRRLNGTRMGALDHGIAVLGDSHAMGWGVNDDETFSAKLEEITGRSVINYGVSSYATEREMDRLIRSQFASSIDTIIIQYCDNDLGPNQHYPIDRVVANNRFIEARSTYTENHPDIASSTLAVYRLTATLFYNMFVPSDVVNYLRLNRVPDISSLEHIEGILRVLDGYSGYLSGKKIVIFYSNDYGHAFDEDWAKTVTRGSYTVSFVDLGLRREHYFRVDDHLNSDGHSFVAQKLLGIID